MADIYSEIETEHDKHRNLLERLVETSGDTTDRKALFEELKADLTAHANAEEQTLYAALLKNPDTQEQARHSIAEHETVDDLLEDLDETDFSNPGWLANAKKLRHKLEHHMEEEEKDVFSIARDALSEAEADKLGADFRQRKVQELKDAA